MKTISTLFLLIFLFTACENNLFQTSKGETEDFYASKVSNGLEIELLVESEEISTLNDIEAVFSLTNISDRELTYGFSTGCQTGYQVNQNERKIYDSTEDMVCTMATSAMQIAPGETKTIEISPIRNENIDLGTGTYTLRTFLLEDHGVEISVFFEVE